MLLVFSLGLVLPSNLQRMHVHGVGGAFCEPQPDHPPALAGEFVVSELLLLGAPVPQCHGGFFAHCLRLPGVSKCPALGCFFCLGPPTPAKCPKRTTQVSHSSTSGASPACRSKAPIAWFSKPSAFDTSTASLRCPSRRIDAPLGGLSTHHHTAPDPFE